MRYPNATEKLVVNHGGPMSRHLGLVLHVQQGDNSLYGWFNNPNSQVSATFWVSKTGVVEQYVDTDITAWAQAAGNSTYNSVETEGYSTDPLTEQQIQALAALYLWGNTAYKWPFVVADIPGEFGLGWHGMGGVAWGGHFDCPGYLRKAQMPIILQLAQGAVIQPPQPSLPGDDDMKFVHVNNQQYLLFGNETKWQINSASFSESTVATLGYPTPSDQQFVDQFATTKTL